MLRNPLFYGISTFVLCLIIFGILLPAATCMDGWESSSIGSQGACSHHGGVDNVQNVIALFISGAIGFFVWSKADKKKKILADPSNKKIEIAENFSKGLLSRTNFLLCTAWNIFVKLLKAIQLLKVIPENGWFLAILIIVISIIFPPLCFVLYPIGIAAIINNADPKNEFLIDINKPPKSN